MKKATLSLFIFFTLFLGSGSVKAITVQEPFLYHYSHYVQTQSGSNELQFHVIEEKFHNPTATTQVYFPHDGTFDVITFQASEQIQREPRLESDILNCIQQAYQLEPQKTKRIKLLDHVQTVTVPPEKSVELNVYFPGFYSEGMAYYKKYSPNGTFMGYVSYSSERVWVSVANNVHVVYEEK